ncbi:GIY-YIG nuclease family protein [Nostoc sp. FACHB-190]|uniref:GIY-YIG nuclease family protein n=1 Tax=Nostoc sp. FACHB-190 TaxID=2692838 RepID=UPI001687804A|nr:GIY-YIG nuclease family protein [Nostoc sp. FACHB-190]MBD2303209.1 GIY-YIG nuclease family protein [Nostoc sp. FACHB-190]
MNVKIINPLKLPSLSLASRKDLPGCPAIYFVLDGDYVLYVGKTNNLQQRWTAHQVLNRVSGSNKHLSIAWLKCDDAGILSSLEKQLIESLRPEWNINKGTKKDDPDYVALRGHIPKELFKRFKMFCLEKEVDNSQGLEYVLQEYFSLEDSKKEEEKSA